MRGGHIGLLRSSPRCLVRRARRLSRSARRLPFLEKPCVHKPALFHPKRKSSRRLVILYDVGMDLCRLAMPIGVGENNPWRAAALLLTLGRVGGVGLADDGRWPCHQGLDEGLGSWFHLRNALRSGQSRVA